MPFVNSPNMWGQTSDVVAHASDDLGNLMTQLPMQKLQMQNIVQEMQRRQQEAGIAQQGAQQSQQLFPLQLQQEQGRIKLGQEQSGLLDERTKLLLQQQNMLEQQQRQLQEYQQRNPNFIPKGVQPQFRQGGGAVYNAFTGQQTGGTQRVLRPGEVLTSATGNVAQQPAGLTGIPGLQAMNPNQPRQTNPFGALDSTLMNHLMQGADPRQLMTNSDSVVSNAINTIMQMNRRLSPQGVTPQPGGTMPQGQQTTNYTWTPNGLVPK